MWSLDKPPSDRRVTPSATCLREFVAEEAVWRLFPTPLGLSVLPQVFYAPSVAPASHLHQGDVETIIYSAPAVLQAWLGS